MTRHKSKSQHAEMGRPEKIDATILAKLEDAFMNAFTDEMACLYAGISPSTLYRYCEDHEDFRQRKEILKRTPDLKAQQTLINDLSTVSGARFWATSRMPDFTPKSKITHDGKIETEDVSTNSAAKAVVDRFEDELRKTIIASRKP